MVPIGATTLDIQIRDSQLGGNVNCATNGCCGDVTTTTCGNVISGVCDHVLDLLTCTVETPPPPSATVDAGAPPATPATPAPPVDPLACNKDADCMWMMSDPVYMTAEDVCAEPKCIPSSKRCAVVPLSKNTVCRAAKGDCDVREVSATAIWRAC